jgi:hypothetical protein
MECVHNCKKPNKEANVSNEVTNENTEFCFYDTKTYEVNSIWSPINCAQCRCNLNPNGGTIVNCFTIECPLINCTNVY